jgi:hippurate hydrolase
MQVIEQIGRFHNDMTAWRHDIHAHPELGFEEHRTSDFVAAQLADFGCEVTRGIGKTGVVGTLRCGKAIGRNSFTIMLSI